MQELPAYRVLTIRPGVAAHFAAQSTGVSGDLEGHGAINISFITMTIHAPDSVRVEVLEGGTGDHGIPIASEILLPLDEAGHAYAVSVGKYLQFRIGDAVSPPFIVPSP